jgi:hypothetical protein
MMGNCDVYFGSFFRALGCCDGRFRLGVTGEHGDTGVMCALPCAGYPREVGGWNQSYLVSYRCHVVKNDVNDVLLVERYCYRWLRFEKNI